MILWPAMTPSAAFGLASRPVAPARWSGSPAACVENCRNRKAWTVLKQWFLPFTIVYVNSPFLENTSYYNIYIIYNIIYIYSLCKISPFLRVHSSFTMVYLPENWAFHGIPASWDLAPPSPLSPPRQSAICPPSASHPSVEAVPERALIALKRGGSAKTASLVKSGHGVFEGLNMT